MVVLMTVPIILDDTTHWLSDLAGIGGGFRYTNAWLSASTGNGLPRSFCSGNALGSFNLWMERLAGFQHGCERNR